MGVWPWCWGSSRAAGTCQLELLRVVGRDSLGCYDSAPSAWGGTGRNRSLVLAAHYQRRHAIRTLTFLDFPRLSQRFDSIKYRYISNMRVSRQWYENIGRLEKFCFQDPSTEKVR